MSGWIGAWGNAATVTNLTVTGSEVIAVNTSTNALRITQTGSGNALLVEDSANPDSSPFVIDANGRTVIGNTAPRSIGGDLFPFTIDGIDYAGSSPAFICNSNNGNPVLLQLAKSRGTTPGSVTSVASGDTLGRVDFRGADGTGLIQAATISAAVDGTPGTNDMPGRLVFSTTADGASSPTERVRIDNAGNVYGTSGTTGMTNGFFYIPAAGGAPSGVPTAISGRVPMYYDSTNNNFYVYNGAWKKVLLA